MADPKKKKKNQISNVKQKIATVFAYCTTQDWYLQRTSTSESFSLINDCHKGYMWISRQRAELCVSYTLEINFSILKETILKRILWFHHWVVDSKVLKMVDVASLSWHKFLQNWLYMGPK